MSDTSRRPATRRRVRPGQEEPRVISWFRQFLSIKDQASVLSERQGSLRDDIIEELTKIGIADDKGNSWFDLPVPIAFEDRTGKVFKYTSLKRERHLLPANPQPEPDKALAVLKKHKLWLTAEQTEAIKALHQACPYAMITVDVDIDAFAKLEFTNQISAKEYESTLQEQKVSYQFRPSES